MSDFIRMQLLDERVKDAYGVDVEVYRDIIDSNRYRIKLVKGDKEAILTEVMKKGLTKLALLQYQDVTKEYKSYHQAEVDAIEYLRS